jgi:hypothetical protein
MLPVVLVLFTVVLGLSMVVYKVKNRVDSQREASIATEINEAIVNEPIRVVPFPRQRWNKNAGSFVVVDVGNGEVWQSISPIGEPVGGPCYVPNN